jgi:hypothetical protein
MSTVQEVIFDDEAPRGLRRALQAVQQMHAKGEPLSGRRVLQHLSDTDGESTSMTAANAALRLWRAERLAKERPMIDRVGAWLMGCTDEALQVAGRMVRDEQRRRTEQKEGNR